MLAVGCSRSWNLVVVSLWMLGQHCSWAKLDLRLSSPGILIRRPSATSLPLCLSERMFHLLAGITSLLSICLLFVSHDVAAFAPVSLSSLREILQDLSISVCCFGISPACVLWKSKSIELVYLFVFKSYLERSLALWKSLQ